MADYPRFVPQNAPLLPPKPPPPKLSPVKGKSKAHYDMDMARVIPTSDEPYKPPIPMSEVPLDIGQSVMTGAADLAEGTIGYLGERFNLAKIINDYFKDKPGGWDAGPGLQQGQDISTRFPTVENVQDYVTNPLLEKLPQGATDWTRHEPRSPWGSAAYEATQFADPTEMLGPASKVGRLARRAF